MAIFHGLRFTTMVATADTCLPQRWWIIVVGDAFTEFIREDSPLSPYNVSALSHYQARIVGSHYFVSSLCQYNRETQTLLTDGYLID